MNKTFINILVIGNLALATSCASRHYAWVKNPAKVDVASSGDHVATKVNKVNLSIVLKEKHGPLVYIENSDEYFVSTSGAGYHQASLVGDSERRPHHKGSKHAEIYQGEEMTGFSARKLNGALIPPNHRRSTADMPVGTETRDTREDAFAERREENAVVLNEEAYRQGLKQLDDAGQYNWKQGSKRAKSKGMDLSSGQAKKNSYLWIGLVLVVAGLITGLIFGGISYVISLIGFIVLVIGYFVEI